MAALKEKLKRLFENPVLMLAVLSAALFYGLCNRDGAVWDNDIFWHIKTGEYIVATRAVPRTDPFSWTVNGAKWTAHEWLWQVLMYVIYQRAGWRVVPVVASLGILGLLWLLYVLCRPKDAREKTAFEVLIPALGVGLWGFLSSARPQVASYLLFAAYLAALQSGGRFVWLLPLLQVIWVNSHASFILGIGFIAWELTWAVVKRSSAAKVLSAVPILDVLACGLSPWGYSVLRYPFVVNASRVMKDAITEWHSPDFKSPEGYIVALWLGLFALALWRSSPKAKDVLLAGIFGFMALQSIRHTPYFVIASFPVVFRWLSGAIPERLVSARPSRTWAAVTVFSVLVAVTVGILSEPTVSENLPVAAVQYIRESGLSRVLNYYDWGGYMIWAGVPAFIDGRADIYIETPLFEESLRFFKLQENPETLLDRYGVKGVLVPPDLPVSTWLMHSPSWGVAYSDEHSLVFIRKE